MVYWQVPIHLYSLQISLINIYEYPLIQIKNIYFKIEFILLCAKSIVLVYLTFDPLPYTDILIESQKNC